MEKFDIKQTSDWYGITKNQLNQIIKIDLRTAMNIIKNFYPEIDVKNMQIGNSKSIIKKNNSIL